MKTKLCSIFILLFLSTSNCAEIIISPNTPNSSQNVNISLTIQYGSAAGITDASITRNGNNFVINQSVDVICLLPVAPILTSTFDVGVLEAGEYQVTANTLNSSSIAGCPPDNTVTENTAFRVADLAIVPLGGFYWVLGLIGLLTLIGVSSLKKLRLSES